MKGKLNYLSICLLPLIIMSCGGNEKRVVATQTVEVVNPVTNGNVGNGTLSGVVKENNTLLLAFETPGKIEQVYVREGDYVQKGKLVATLDDKDYVLGVKSIQAQYNQQKNEAARLKVLFEQRALSGNDFEKTMSGLEQTKAQLDTYKNKLSYTRLTAPVSGYIQSVSFHRGEMVNAGTAIASMIDVSRLEVEVSLPTDYYLNKEHFGKVTCTSPHFPGKVFNLSNMNIVMKSDGNQLYQVKFTIEGNDAKTLTAGSNVEVTIPINGINTDQTILLPQCAVGKDKNGSFVWIVTQDNKLKRCAVEMVSLDGGSVKVKGTLNASDRVVKAGVQTLHEGEKVEIHTTTTPTNEGGLL